MSLLEIKPGCFREGGDGFCLTEREKCAGDFDFCQSQDPSKQDRKGVRFVPDLEWSSETKGREGRTSTR